MAAFTNHTYAVVGRAGLNQEVGTTSDTQKHPLGDRIVVKDTASSSNRGFAECVYLKGVASTVEGSIVLIKDDYTTSLAAARDKGGLAAASAAIVANQYGWYFTKGTFVVATANAQAVSANVPLYLAGSGALDDAAVAGDQVIGLRSNAAADTNTALATAGVAMATADFDNA